MFRIESVRQDESGRVLALTEDLFHEALRDNPQSKARYHVINDRGEDFDIVYWDNDLDLEPRENYPAYVKPPYMAKYHTYDEHDRDTLYLDFFKGFTYMVFEELNEYTIAISRVILEFTDLEIWCRDRRISWFVSESPRIHFVDAIPSDWYEDDCFYIQQQCRSGLEDNNFNRLSDTYAFHNVFFLQWILDGRSLSDFRFMTLPINDAGGIGALLSGYQRYKSAFAELGLKFAAPDKDRFGKYPREMVERYFAVDMWDPEANEANTLVVPNTVLFIKTRFCQSQPGSMDVSVIKPSFRDEMDTYYDAVLGDKKTLGILIRGSDYFSTGLAGSRKMASVEQMVPGIRRWMADYGYERLFLATEDSDILRQMRDEFGHDVVALAQRRVKRSDLREGQILSELERERGGADYAENLEDTTVNYFYALYILSRCNAFMCSGQCNGWDTVQSLNDGRFERSRKFTVGIDGDPRTEGWKVIRPVTAGMFARAAYPTDKAFFMTYRLDLAEPVDSGALRDAWEKTVGIYPYVTYATVVRKSTLMLAENPLDFVIRETAEVIEPSTPEANFHTVTLCYLGSTLWVYADHVPFDGTGFLRVLESLLYHYYCALDGIDYPVPEGVHTEQDGVVEGQDTDAYLEAEPADVGSALGAFAGGEAFVVPEAAEGVAFVDKADCRGYCVSVPSKYFVAYARSVKGSPMSVLAVSFAKALQRVHPENALPVSLVAPVSIRKVMGNANSLLHQVVHLPYSFEAADLTGRTDEELNAGYRAALAAFASSESIRRVAGMYRSVCEGNARAFARGVLDKLTTDRRRRMAASVSVSYLGTLRTAGYGSRVRMTAFHVMQEKGIMLQVTEVGGRFCIDWYQGFHGEEYVRAMRDVLAEKGIGGVTIERVE